MFEHLPGFLRAFERLYTMRRNRRARAFESIVDKKFRLVKSSHDRFRAILTDLRQELRTLDTDVHEAQPRDAVRLLREFETVTLEKVLHRRSVGRSNRRITYAEALAVVDGRQPLSGPAVVILSDDETQSIKIFMEFLVNYFRQENYSAYSHTVDAVVREIGAWIRDYDLNRKIIGLARIRVFVREKDDELERKWGELADAYAAVKRDLI